MQEDITQTSSLRGQRVQESGSLWTQLPVAFPVLPGTRPLPSPKLFDLFSVICRILFNVSF
jgi:hypothetical protein